MRNLYALPDSWRTSIKLLNLTERALSMLPPAEYIREGHFQS